MTPYNTDEARKHFKRRMYAVLLHMAEAALGPNETWIVRKHPENNWKHMLTNLHTTGLTDTLKSTWYIQDVPGGMCQTSGECSLC